MPRRLTLSVLLIAAASVAQDQPYWRPVVMGTEAMVVAEHPLEALAGLKVLEAQKGLLDYEDLAKFEPEESEPIHTDSRGLDVYQSAPNSQGIVMLIALEILEGYDVEALGHNDSEYLHLVTEALKLAFADRNQWVADPRFVDVPVAGSCRRTTRWRGEI